MNVLDLELFDLTANNLQKSLKQLDKFYPNEKSLADYLEAMSEIPPEEWKRFEPIKGEGERIALQNLSHFGAALLVMVAKIYNDAEETKKAAIDLLEENKRLNDKIHDLKASENHWFKSWIDCNTESMEMDKLLMKTIEKKQMTV